MFLVWLVGEVAVDLLKDFVGVRLIFDRAERSVGQARVLVVAVIPRERLDRLILGLGRSLVEFLQSPTQVPDKPQVGAAIAFGIDGLVVPLDRPLCIGERALLGGDARGGN